MTADRLAKALELALRQNEHDMLLTGEEIRQCREALATHRAQAPAEGALEAAFAWIEEAVEYVNEATRSPSLERDGRALLHRLSTAIKDSKAQPKAVKTIPSQGGQP